MVTSSYFSYLSYPPFFFTVAPSLTSSLTSSPSVTATSSLSLVLLLTFLSFLYLTSSPFHSNLELSTFNHYAMISSVINLWLLMTLVLYLMPAFQGKGNAVVAGTLFFPVFLATLFVGERLSNELAFISLLPAA